MNPDDIFAPCGIHRGGPYNPTEKTPATSSPPPVDATVLLDETDRLGITTVLIHKRRVDAEMGIHIKYVPNIGLVLDDFQGGSVLDGTKLRPTMNLLSINGFDCSSMSAPEAMLLISSTEGELTIQAVHSQVLLWDNSNNSSNDSQIHPPNPEPTPHTASSSPPKIIKAVVQKSSKHTSLGLMVGNETTGTTSFPVIVKIYPGGLCANTALRVGMRIWSVNGLRCYTKEDTMTKLKRIKGVCYIEAQQVVVVGEEGPKSDGNSETGGRIPSHKPKSWFPCFNRRRAQETTNPDSIPVDLGESA